MSLNKHLGAGKVGETVALQGEIEGWALGKHRVGYLFVS